MSNYFLLYVSLLVSMYSYGVSSDPLSAKTLQEFMDMVVPVGQHTEFSTFYQHLINQVHRKKVASKTTIENELVDSGKISALEELGRASLEVKNRVWFEQLYEHEQDTHCKSAVKTFLVRYGAYEEFIKNNAEREYTWWNRACSYTKTVSNTVVSWFSSLRKSPTA